MTTLVLPERIEHRIHLIRGHKVMLDRDLADLYEVETKALNRGVKRNLTRFPKDFMFQLTRRESNSLRCQIGTLDAKQADSKDVSGKGRHPKYLPYAFTEQGIAMLSSVLNSERALECAGLTALSLRAGSTARSWWQPSRNIKGCQHSYGVQSMTGGVKPPPRKAPSSRRTPNFLATHRDLARKLDDLEQKYDAQFADVFDAIRQLMEPPPSPRKPIGFTLNPNQGRNHDRLELQGIKYDVPRSRISRISKEISKMSPDLAKPKRESENEQDY
jgi:hypothetical protein